LWQNLAFASGVIALLVLLTFGVGLPLTLAVVGHEGSTLLVVLNGLRLLRWKGKPATEQRQSCRREPSPGVQRRIRHPPSRAASR
jgi:Cd2+/Zn2+-exporting ATPase